MAIDRTWLYAGLIVAAGISISSILKAGPRVKKGDRILLFGDSLAVGLAPPLSDLAKSGGVGFTGIGKVGSTVRDWAGQSQLNTELRAKLAERPTVVLCSLGTNDEALSPDSARAEVPLIDTLIALIRDSGAELGWVGPPRLQKTNGFSAIIQSKLPQNRYFHSEKYDIPRANDGLHPTVLGYAGWAGVLWRWVSG